MHSNAFIFNERGSADFKPINDSAHIMTAATRYEKPIDYRLPTNVRPTHYDLTFKTDLEGLKFWGYGIIEYVLEGCNGPRQTIQH